MSTRKIVFLSIMISISIVLSIVESIIAGYFFTFPGIKLGLANIATLVVIFSLGRKEAIIVALTRIVLVGLIYSGIFTPTFMISLGGGVLALLVMLALKDSKLSIYTISVMASLMHMVGQIIIVIFVVHTTSLIYYLPYMLLMSVPTGFITAYLANILLKRLNSRYLNFK